MGYARDGLKHAILFASTLPDPYDSTGPMLRMFTASARFWTLL